MITIFVGHDDGAVVLFVVFVLVVVVDDVNYVDPELEKSPNPKLLSNEPKESSPNEPKELLFATVEVVDVTHEFVEVFRVYPV